MELISMKLPKRKKNENSNIPIDISDRWPYGLRINLETEQLKTLPELLKKKVGDKCIVYAEATIISTRELERRNGEKKQNVELQIEKINIKPKVNKAVKDMNPKEYREYRKNNGGE